MTQTKSKNNLLIIFFLVAMGLICSFGVQKNTVHAASYPLLIVESRYQDVCIGENGKTVYNYFPEFTNEKIKVDIYNPSGKRVAGTAERQFYNTSTAMQTYTINWDTAGYEPGKYKIEATIYFYSLYEWHESPSKTTSYITLRYHDESVEVLTPATLNDNGSGTFTCSLCGKVETRDIPKIDYVGLSTSSYTYNGKVKAPSVIAEDAMCDDVSCRMVKGTDFDVKYATGRKNVGKYKVTVTFKGKYAGTKTLYFKINPQATSISSLSKGTKKFTVKWKKKTTQVTGYQVRYSTKSSMSGAKTSTISSYKTTSKTIKGLKAKKKYYVQVRTYKTVSGTKYYSAWSSKKAVKTK